MRLPCDSTEPEDLQDIDGHLRGGIPVWDIDGDATKKVKGFADYWKIMPSLRAALFQPFTRAGYLQLAISAEQVKPVIFSHPEFTTFNAQAKGLFTQWQAKTVVKLKNLAKGGHPKPLIENIAEDLLSKFRAAPLLDAYDVYQHLMEYWAETMQDDSYIIADVGWVEGAKPREIVKVKNKEGKLVWPEKGDFKKGKRRFQSDLVPSDVLIARYFSAERDAIAALMDELASIEQQLDEARDEHGGEEGLLEDVFSGETNEEKEKSTQGLLKARKSNAKARLKDIGRDSEYADERQAIESYLSLLDRQAHTKDRLKTAEDDLEAKVNAKYPTLTEADIQTLVVDDKWLATLAATVQGELDRVSQTLTGRIRQLAERYATPLPQLTDEVAALAAKVDQHLQKMGAVWK
jgi:type I restriction enzyme M protein